MIYAKTETTIIINSHFCVLVHERLYKLKPPYLIMLMWQVYCINCLFAQKYLSLSHTNFFVLSGSLKQKTPPSTPTRRSPRNLPRLE